MKSFFAAALLGAFASAKVHEFFAEANYMCELCKTAMKFDTEGDSTALDALYAQNPGFERHLAKKVKRAEDLLMLYDSTNPAGTCERLDFCNGYDVKEMIQNEFPVDFDYIIEAVNRNPASTWVAGHNDKF